LKSRIEIWLLAAAAVILAGCKDYEADYLINYRQADGVSLAFSVASPSATRMADYIVQEGSNRNMADIDIIPFRKEGTVEATDIPTMKTFKLSSLALPNPKYFDAHCSFMSGTASVLFYGRATPATGGNAVNGALTKTPSDLSTVSKAGDIKFSPVPIYNVRDDEEKLVIPEKAHDLADYLTAIANTSGWSEASDAMRSLRDNFINNGVVISGSASSVKAHVDALKANLGNDDLGNRIKNVINNNNSSLANNYPASENLPDGAAIVKWNYTTSKFEPQIETTTEANITNIMRFAYPPELYYTVNSRFKATRLNDRTQIKEADTWEGEGGVLSYYSDDDAVLENAHTAIAIKKPIQYAVGRLEVKLMKVETTLKDANDDDVTVGTETFPLTGIIIGNQHPVEFDFTPEDGDANVKLVYDSQVKVKNNDNSESYLYLSTTADVGPSRTLVLQTRDSEKVDILLEFANKGNTFYGVNGPVYKDTKFYLAANFGPDDAVIGTPDTRPEEAKDRVFTQDYTTILNAKVISLKNAYCLLPDLLTAKLEVGVELTPDWKQSTPTNTELEPDNGE
jgi:hypothetical protein